MDNHRACREVGCIDIEQSNPYLNNKRAFTVDRSLQGADLELKGEKKTGKGIGEYATSFRTCDIIQMRSIAIIIICIFRK